MDVQKRLFHAYKTYRSLSSRRPAHCDGLHLAMDPAHRALRVRHSQRHVVGKWVTMGETVSRPRSHGYGTLSTGQSIGAFGPNYTCASLANSRTTVWVFLLYPSTAAVQHPGACFTTQVVTFTYADGQRPTVNPYSLQQNYSFALASHMPLNAVT